ncbi:hypothetical protein [Rossellomorea sp. NRS-1567]|uniref:hypothetical protein n=1 Tax=Rossellomorea sp. NRS-1567 TaxID=3233901 RepID=UPI003D27C0AD
MSNHTFRPFLDAFLTAWKCSSLMELEHFISKDYQARGVSIENLKVQHEQPL